MDANQTQRIEFRAESIHVKYNNTTGIYDRFVTETMS